jgi:hypothetical protein
MRGNRFRLWASPGRPTYELSAFLRLHPIPPQCVLASQPIASIGRCPQNVVTQSTEVTDDIIL